MPVFKKELIHHPYLYVIGLEKAPELPWVIFIHGGPGLNAGTLELLIEMDGIFNSLNCNVVLYDQRNCGRSSSCNNTTVTHADNVSDLNSIVTTICKNKCVTPAAILGHSYGAKILFDYLQEVDSKLPGVFLSTASSILIPRINNLLLDLNYLKSTDRAKYQALLEEFNNNSIWEMTEKLSSTFKENESRPNFYWANMEWKDIASARQNEIALPMNTEVFNSVRRDLYSSPSNYSVDISSLKNCKYLWINGFHDFVMGGQVSLSNPAIEATLFYKSAHYPHIEENEKFCEEINAFVGSQPVL